MKNKVILSILLTMLSIFTFSSLVSASEIALGVQFKNQIYNPGETLNYQVSLLKDNVPFQDLVVVRIAAVNGDQAFTLNVQSNQENYLKIEDNFSSGYWKIEAIYQNKTTNSLFSIAKKSETQFLIQGTNLVIINNGNVPYEGEITILIGSTTVKQKQYIEPSKNKSITLVAPDGNYKVQVFADGKLQIETAQEIHLTGTGKAIGAIDESLIKNQPALGGGGISDTSAGDVNISNNSVLPIVFIGMVAGLFILLMIERVMRKKRGI